MTFLESLLGLPWQLAEQHLQAAGLSYRVIQGKNYERLFQVNPNSLYVTRILPAEHGEKGYEVLLHSGMVESGFKERKDVSYAKVFLK